MRAPSTNGRPPFDPVLITVVPAVPGKGAVVRAGVQFEFYQADQVHDALQAILFQDMGVTP